MMANPASTPDDRMLQAGAAVVDITPSKPVFLYGYPHVPRESTGVHDPLECAALFLRGSGGSALFLACDLIWVTKQLAAEVRRRITVATGVPEEAIMLASTHTHSGPVISNCLSNAADPIVPPPNPEYLAWLGERMIEAARRAAAAAEPAEIGLAVACAQGVGSNRHDPSGPTDSAVPVLVAQTGGARVPIGCLVIYGMHPTVLHEDSTLVSADFPHFTRRWLQQSVLPASCPVLYLQGAAGDQSPRYVSRGNSFAEAQRLGEALGHAIAQVIPTIDYRSDVTVRSRRAWLELAIREFPDADTARRELEKARARLARLRQEGAARPVWRTTECDVFGAEETEELVRAAHDGRMAAAVAACTPAEIQLIAIGPWRFVGWPGEHFVAHALAVKSRAPDTFVVTLANGELQGYIATAEADARGYYEARNAIFASHNGSRFVEATRALLASLP